MSILDDINGLITGVPAFIGYAASGQKLPYVASRPLLADDLEAAIAGNAIDWDFQFTIYCCAASVAASFNLAMMVMNQLQGQRVGGTTLAVSLGYDGALVEGHYESAVVVQLHQGVLV